MHTIFIKSARWCSGSLLTLTRPWWWRVLRQTGTRIITVRRREGGRTIVHEPALFSWRRRWPIILSATGVVKIIVTAICHSDPASCKVFRKGWPASCWNHLLLIMVQHIVMKFSWKHYLTLPVPAYRPIARNRHHILATIMAMASSEQPKFTMNILLEHARLMSEERQRLLTKCGIQRTSPLIYSLNTNFHHY